MTLGGTDIIIPVHDSRTAMQLALRAAIALWRRPVFEDADTGQTFDDYRDLAVKTREEILIYRDARAQAQWRELGADPSLDGTMIHLIAGHRELTIGVDDVPGNAIAHYVQAVRRALHQDIFASRAGSARRTKDAA